MRYFIALISLFFAMDVVAGESESDIEHSIDVSLTLGSMGGIEDEEFVSNTTFLSLRGGVKSYWTDKIRTEFAGSIFAIHNDSGTQLTEVPAAYRLTPMEWVTYEDGYQSLNSEIDRANITINSADNSSQLIIGRQAIGLGSRGVLFTSVDFFAPFSPLDVDREYKRGVDGIWYDKMLSDTTSFSVAAAFGETKENSVYVARLRGVSYESNFDAELIFGARGNDEVVAFTTSAPIGDAELHAEVAIFNVDEADPSAAVFGDDNLRASMVIGTSYNFDIGESGLKVFLDYHYNGFGGEDITDIMLRSLDATFQSRLARGDFQTLGRHAIAFQAQKDIGEYSSVGLNVIGNPNDASGIVTLSYTYSLTEKTELLLAGYAPYGEKMDGIVLKSEYGDRPLMLMAQARIQF